MTTGMRSVFIRDTFAFRARAGRGALSPRRMMRAVGDGFYQYDSRNAAGTQVLSALCRRISSAAYGGAGAEARARQTAWPALFREHPPRGYSGHLQPSRRLWGFYRRDGGLCFPVRSGADTGGYAKPRSGYAGAGQYSFAV